MGNRLSVVAVNEKDASQIHFLLLEGGSPLRFDLLLTLHKRFPNAIITHLSPKTLVELEDVEWDAYDIVLISCPSGINAELSWLNRIKSRQCYRKEPVVFVITGEAKVGREAVRQGADVYLFHDVANGEFALQLDVALEVERLFRHYPFCLPEWRLIEVLHNSENAVIFLAEDDRGESAAIKRFKFNGSLLNTDVVRDFQLTSARLMQSRQPGLARLFDAGVAQEAVYLVMEYLKGGTLKEQLMYEDCHNLGVRLRWFREVVLAVGTIHELGLLHGDIKSSNVWVRDEGSVVLLDYGIESQLLLSSGFIQDGEIYCTPSYVSPERIIGEPATVQSDLYSLGVLFYEVLTGQRPYESDTLDNLLKMHLLAATPTLPVDLSVCQPLLSTLMAKSPESRLSTAQDVLLMLDSLTDLFKSA